jgi:DNA-binding transcriptional MerR regulator
MSTAVSDQEQGYRIGAVARLTGIETVTIRMWERRYALVEPRRSPTGNRLYTRDDIARLALIKRLVDDGNAIGTIARLTLDQLRERLDLQLVPEIGAELGSQCAVAVLGDGLSARLIGNSADLQGLRMVAVERDQKAFLRATSRQRPDVIVLEFPTVGADSILDVMSLMTRSGAKRAVVVYGFGRRADIVRLESDRVSVLKAPVGPGEVRMACAAPRVASGPKHLPLTPPEPPAAGQIPTRRFDTDAMLRLAEASTRVHCECPKHLVDLLFSLTAFETYSVECVDRSPEDADLHTYLHMMTAQARSLVEDALAKLVEIEGLG